MAAVHLGQAMQFGHIFQWAPDGAHVGQEYVDPGCGRGEPYTNWDWCAAALCVPVVFPAVSPWHVLRKRGVFCTRAALCGTEGGKGCPVQQCSMVGFYCRAESRRSERVRCAGAYPPYYGSQCRDSSNPRFHGA